MYLVTLYLSTSSKFTYILMYLNLETDHLCVHKSLPYVLFELHLKLETFETCEMGQSEKKSTLVLLYINAFVITNRIILFVIAWYCYSHVIPVRQ